MAEFLQQCGSWGVLATLAAWESPEYCKGRLGLDAPREIAGRIQAHRVPLQVEHFRRHHHATLAAHEQGVTVLGRNRQTPLAVHIQR